MVEVSLFEKLLKWLICNVFGNDLELITYIIDWTIKRKSSALLQNLWNVFSKVYANTAATEAAIKESERSALITISRFEHLKKKKTWSSYHYQQVSYLKNFFFSFSLYLKPECIITVCRWTLFEAFNMQGRHIHPVASQHSHSLFL